MLSHSKHYHAELDGMSGVVVYNRRGRMECRSLIAKVNSRVAAALPLLRKSADQLGVTHDCLVSALIRTGIIQTIAFPRINDYDDLMRLLIETKNQTRKNKTT